MKHLLLVALLVAGCGGNAPQPATVPVARISKLDSATIRQLCAKPDSVLAGQATCVLRDQREPLRVLPKPPAEHPPSN